MNKPHPLRAARVFDLFVISALALYSEMVVIRWLAAEVRLFAYLKNLTLLAAFLGLGLGTLRANATRLPAITHWLAGGLTFALVFAPQIGLTRLFFPDPALYQWGGALASPSLVPAARAMPVLGAAIQWMPNALVPWVIAILAFIAGSAIFALVTAVFYSIGRYLGFSLGRVTPPLKAYTVHLLGGLVGVLAQAAVVFQSAPPWTWMLPIVAGLAYFSKHRLLTMAALSGSLGAAFAAQPSDNARWSPYYRVSYAPSAPGTYTLSVDHDYHQDLFDLRPEVVTASPSSEEARKYYDLPYALASRCERALIVGGGTGNDVAAALRAGCGQVDAVDIDPVITDLGRTLHPEAPYRSNRVTLTIEDGRAFVHQKRSQKVVYDIVVFGLVDSLTALSVLSTVRLEFFLYSVEAFREALALVDPEHGLLVVGFSVGWKAWVQERIFRTLTSAAGYQPLVGKASEYLGAVVFVTGPGLATARAAMRDLPYVGDITASVTATDTAILTDDWPFLYHQPGTIPLVYIATLLLVVFVAWVSVRRIAARDTERGVDWPMFLMGSGFMLVTTKNISQLSILFGGTWIVYTVASASMLAMSVVANLLVTRKPQRRVGALCLCLAAALLVGYAFPMSRLMLLPTLWRWIAGGALAALPVLFSSLMFAQLFRVVRNPAAALGSNLLGALFGGAIESLSLLAGIRAMALLAVGLYGATWAIAAAENARSGAALEA